MPDESRPTEPSIQMFARLPNELHEAIKALAAENDRTLAAEVRRAIRFHLERGGQP